MGFHVGTAWEAVDHGADQRYRFLMTRHSHGGTGFESTLA